MFVKNFTSKTINGMITLEVESSDTINMVKSKSSALPLQESQSWPDSC
jgi:hypothetical protein